jgi:hypothetical protein
LLIISAILAFLMGYIAQDILYTVWIMGAGAVSACLVRPRLESLTSDCCPTLGISPTESYNVAASAGIQHSDI